MEVTRAIPEQKPSEAEPGSHLHFPCPEICSVQVGTSARLASSPGTEGSEHSRHVRWARNKPLCLKATKVWKSSDCWSPTSGCRLGFCSPSKNWWTQLCVLNKGKNSIFEVFCFVLELQRRLICGLNVGFSGWNRKASPTISAIKRYNWTPDRYYKPVSGSLIYLEHLYPISRK